MSDTFLKLVKLSQYLCLADVINLGSWSGLDRHKIKRAHTGSLVRARSRENLGDAQPGAVDFATLLGHSQQKVQIGP